MILVYILNTYNPGQAGPHGILIVFICIYVISLGFFLLSFDAIIRFMRRAFPENRTYNDFDIKKAYYIASIIAFLPTLLLAVQSVGQLQLTDVLLALVFISLAIFYVLKRA